MAEHDLAEIGDFIALDSRAAALAFVAGIEARFTDIARQPALYRLRGEVMPGVRAATHGRYLIYFLCEHDDEVLFLRVLHSARDQSAAMRSD